MIKEEGLTNKEVKELLEIIEGENSMNKTIEKALNKSKILSIIFLYMCNKKNYHVTVNQIATITKKNNDYIRKTLERLVTLELAITTIGNQGKTKIYHINKNGGQYKQYIEQAKKTVGIKKWLRLILVLI